MKSFETTPPSDWKIEESPTMPCHNINPQSLASMLTMSRGMTKYLLIVNIITFIQNS